MDEGAGNGDGDGNDDGDGNGDGVGTGDGGVRVWFVERTYSDDEQNLIIITYATPDGERYFRKERALTSFGDDRETPVSLVVDPDDLGSVDDPETSEWYADEAAEMAETHGPDGTL